MLNARLRKIIDSTADEHGRSLIPLRAGLHQSVGRNAFMIVRADGSALWIGDGRTEEHGPAAVQRVAWAWTPVLTDGDGSDGEPVDPALITELITDTTPAED